jgi:glucose/arabinose dehydrogenase
MGRVRTAAGLAALLLLLLAPAARGAALSQIGSFDQPTYVTSAPGDPNRLFVAEREGTVVERAGGTSTLFADLSSLVGCGGSCAGERGLLSIAVAPDFETSGRFFVDYAESPEPGDIHVAEMQAVGGTALAATPRDLLTIHHPDHANHNGGQLQFGPEGNLFVSTGDGGGNDDEEHNAQDLESPLGKILRIRPGPVGSGSYTVPSDNPFATAAPPYDTIWSYGLRNPFRFSFDRARGTLTIGDVGQGAREEVDFAPPPGIGAGANFGWSCREGLIAGPASDPRCDAAAPASFVQPVFDYPHTDLASGAAHGCAIIGGYVARGPNLGELFGRYLYGDLCVGQSRSFCPAAPAATDRAEGPAVKSLDSFGEDSAGRLYAVSEDGPVYRLSAAGTPSCEVSQTPPPPGPSLEPSFVGIRALRARVPRNRRTMVTAWVAPCEGRRGQPVTLWQGPRRIGVRHLDRVCTARFRPKIRRLTRFRATAREDATHQGAISRRLTIRIDRRRPRHRHRSRVLSSFDSATGWAQVPGTR